MKSCDRIEKRITLSDLDDRSIKERDEIAKHIEKCAKCSQKVKEMNKYYRLIQSLRDTKPELINAAELTDSIFSAVSELKESYSAQPERNQFKIQPFYYKIAAIILLFVMTGFYLQQSLYVNQMESSLRLTYASKKANKPLMNSYNECLKFSEDFIKNEMINDTHYLNLLLKFSQKYPLKSYRNFASEVCLKSNTEFNSADLEMKKRMVIEMLNSNLNQNH
jgi:hypothetical protein